MMSSRRAAPHQGSGCVTPPTHEAEYMAATVFPSASAHTALAFGLGPYMTDEDGLLVTDGAVLLAAGAAR
jgi:cysteine sulfinate desulfinase/cysteine desulfurase-like protein